ncbi:MAG: hypothetical protein KKC76_13630 [Proteobacteria bacterium]|nr:hypothetical protein [Pseudomonadota bacterium]MBU4296625.1 hypothetical protein [Pseudomonadota bacterium]MCG2748254.1 hypothetical protein [Desulfobulbaceae bacterium]
MQTVVWKIILSIALFLSFIFFSFTIVESLQNRDLSFQPGAANRQKEHSLPPLAKEIRFYPSLPARLPDLSEGYLFNQERKIQSAETQEDMAGDDTISIDVDEARYAGSLISGNMRKGLIRYPVATMPINRGARARVTNARRPPSAKWSSRIVEEGETVSGYLVVSISPGALVFEKGGSQFEKKLYTPDKERVAFTPPMNRSRPAPKTAVRKTKRSYEPGTKAGSTNSTRVRTPITKRSTVRR